MYSYPLPGRKIITRLLIAGCILLMQLSLVAQVDAKAREDSLFAVYSAAGGRLFTSDKPYYIAAWKDKPVAGLTVIRQLDEHTAIIALDNATALANLVDLLRLAPANDRWKLSPVASLLFGSTKPATSSYILSGLSLDAVLAAIVPYESQVSVLQTDKLSNSVVVKTSGGLILEKLLRSKEIIFIDAMTSPHTEVNIIGYNRSFHGINVLDYSIPGANGKNIVAGIKEQRMDTEDIDLQQRVLPSTIAAPAIESHATVIASIIGGAGNSFYDGRGLASSCRFFPSSFSNLFADDVSILNANRVTVQNHSYGTVIQSFYGAEAVSYDAQTWANKNMLHVFSAGNRGTAVATDGSYANIPGYANLTGNFKMAKNVITVGAIDNKENLPAESSAGPLYDGRMAPQLIALGPNGTSDAAAVVSGTIAVLQQVYADSNSQTIPPASLVKATLFNTADDMYRSGIDHRTGYGLLNSAAAVRSVLQRKYDGGTLSQGQQWVKNISVPANAASFKITLAWTDSTALVNNFKALINDLDLEVTELSTGTVYKPWVLSSSPHIDSLVKLPIRKRDSLNTAEQVSLVFPSAGTYEVKVTGTAVLSSVSFYIAYGIDTLHTFHFTSPQHTSDVNRAENENLFIRWKTFVADTNTTGNLYVSYNRGIDWRLVKASHKIYTNKYIWPIKDTSSTGLFKMETPFGDFLSSEFVIHPVTLPEVDFLCADSFRLSWGKHLYASSYRVYTLTDSAYLKPVRTVTDTFTVFNRSIDPTVVYAVEPVLANGLPAARSVALDIRQQGVQCFYKTLFYSLLNGNELDLSLELSIASYTDSVFFERVTAGGQLLQTWGGAVVLHPQRMYQQFVKDLPSGVIFFRARIKLKSGASVFTNIVSVLTSGPKMLLFYPNPAQRTGELFFVLQQGIPADSRLQLFDMTGRMVRNYLSISGRIAVSALPPGLLIYKLVTAEGELLETGKVVVL